MKCFSFWNEWSCFLFHLVEFMSKLTPAIKNVFVLSTSEYKYQNGRFSAQTKKNWHIEDSLCGKAYGGERRKKNESKRCFHDQSKDESKINVLPMYKILWTLNWNMDVVYVDNPRHNVPCDEKWRQVRITNRLQRNSKRKRTHTKRAKWKEFVLWFSARTKNQNW